MAGCGRGGARRGWFQRLGFRVKGLVKQFLSWTRPAPGR